MKALFVWPEKEEHRDVQTPSPFFEFGKMQPLEPHPANEVVMQKAETVIFRLTEVALDGALIYRTQV